MEQRGVAGISSLFTEGGQMMAKKKMVHDEEFVPDELYEEERIMFERSKAPRTLGAHTLRVPISTIDLAKPVVVKPAASVADAIKLMQKGRFGAVLVEDKKKLVGIFTERDVMMKLAGNQEGPREVQGIRLHDREARVAARHGQPRLRPQPDDRGRLPSRAAGRRGQPPGVDPLHQGRGSLPDGVLREGSEEPSSPPGSHEPP